MRTTFTAITLAAAVMFSPLVVNAASHHDGQHWQKKTMQMHGQHAKRGFKHNIKLNLSQEQKDQLFKMRHDRAQQVYDQKKAVNTAQKALKELTGADKFDADQAKKISQDLGQAKAELALLRAQARADFNSVLTAEQKQIIADAKAARAAKK